MCSSRATSCLPDRSAEQIYRGGSLRDLMESMSEKILPLSDDVNVLPGHGPATTVGHERRTNPFLTGLA